MSDWTPCPDWKKCGSPLQGKPHLHRPETNGPGRWSRYPIANLGAGQ